MTPEKAAHDLSAWIDALTPVVLKLIGVGGVVWIALVTQRQNFLARRLDRHGAAITTLQLTVPPPNAPSTLSVSTGDATATATTGDTGNATDGEQKAEN